ncbi:putative PEP-binding protein [Rubrimonas sp.]|uniref:putative PEP-binding protein n=1 Tax=Rubrimonas sp. TaxID=2036015 RepID=UPI002FDD67D8
MTPPSEISLQGVCAAPGFAQGPLARLDAPAASGPARRAGDPSAEAAALRAALSCAEAEIAALRATLDPLAADILEFQEMLAADEDLSAPAFAAIAKGAPADAAWARALDAEIADYAAAADETMAARASDLRDLRDRVLRALRGESGGESALPDGAILFARDLAPSQFLALDWSRLGGAALGAGAPTSHVAILARARGVPMAVGLGEPPADVAGDALLDAGAGRLTLGASAPTRGAFAAQAEADRMARAEDAAFARRPGADASGAPVAVLINVDDPGLLDALDPAICDGVGLTRTEFLFEGGAPDEETQFRAYARVLGWAKGRPVTIRTLDAGGDKPVPGVTLAGEANPFLGLRGLRLSLARPDLFRVQLRALARAAALGPLKVMVPMVTAPHEFEAARAHLRAALEELRAEGAACAEPPLGIMVETPAAALTAADFDAAFYSIGSNDLTQYVCAAARDAPEVAALADPLHPAVLELIARTAQAGAARGVEVSLCGDMASRPDLAETLLRCGVRAFSVAPASVGAVKRATSQARP